MVWVRWKRRIQKKKAMSRLLSVLLIALIVCLQSGPAYAAEAPGKKVPGTSIRSTYVGGEPDSGQSGTGSGDSGGDDSGGSSSGGSSSQKNKLTVSFQSISLTDKSGTVVVSSKNQGIDMYYLQV